MARVVPQPLLRACADDQRPRPVPLAPEPGERTQQVLVALLPDEAPDGQHQVLGGSGRLAEPRGVDAGRRDLDQVVSGSFEQERAPCAVGGCKKQVDLGNRLPVAAGGPGSAR